MSANPSSPDKLSRTHGQLAVRVAGAVLLTTSAAMVVLGTTLWSARLQGLIFVRYWTWCFLLTILLFGVALADLVLVRRAFQRRRRELFRQQFLTREFTDKLRRRPEQDPDEE